MQELIQKLKQSSFIRYFIVGCSAFVLDMGTLFVFTNFFQLHPVVSVVINQIIILVYIFFINKIWSFGSQGETSRELLRFLSLTGLNYIIAVSWMWFWTDKLKISILANGVDIGYLIARTINIVLAICWNFLSYKHWVYKKHAKTEVIQLN